MISKKGNMMKNEEIIKKYCIQIRRPFCLSEISENTGIDKSICHGYIHQFSQDGLIERVCGTERPKYYRWVTQKIKPICKPSDEMIEKVKPFYGSDMTHEEISIQLRISRSSVSMAMAEIDKSNPEKEIKDKLVEDIFSLLNAHEITCSKKLYKLSVDELTCDLANLREYVYNNYLNIIPGYKKKINKAKNSEELQKAIQSGMSTDSVAFEFKVPYSYVRNIKNKMRKEMM